MTNGKRRILFVSIDLKPGGAERVLATILQHLDKTRFESILALFIDTKNYQTPEDVPVICLNKKGWWSYPIIVWKLSRLYRQMKPDVTFSFLTYTNVICVLAKILSNARLSLILCEHFIPSFYLKQSKNPLTTLFLKWMPRWFYSYANKVVCVSQTSANEINKIFKVPIEKIKVIYNPINIEHILALCNENIEHPWFAQNIPIIISVGRLTDVKGYQYLLRAFKQLTMKNPSRLVILGQGQREESLKKLASQLGIDKSVAFLGFQSNPFKYLSHSKLFVLSSLSEAFPMVVLEAMACGIPIVSTASPGSSEIITNGTNGLLVPLADEQSLAEAMEKLLKDKILVNNIILSGKKRIRDFSLEKVIKEYEELFQIVD